MKEQKKAKYWVGIDLGTTHTVVAYSAIAKPDQAIKIFEITQLVALGEVAKNNLLPSVRYHPAEGELSAEDVSFSPAGSSAVVGAAARVLGAKTLGRLVTSAKSWLSHGNVDPTADILPWGSGDDIAKVSPLDASAGYLAHVRTVWGHQFNDAPLEEQEIVITVPASFDQEARSLTLEAASQAGLHHVRLLEEPQAVCYDWLRRHADHLKQALQKIRLLLICDVGGGTTDLTLIKIDASKAEPELNRIGVGDHLMLGGDNIDLTLARMAESRINPGGNKLSVAEFTQLIEQCRSAKERLLADDAPEQMNVTLLGGGSKLIGGSRTTVLSREEVREVALDGFFPLSKLDELPDKKRSGVVEFGLPYAAEPAVSKHIAAFLKMHGETAKQARGDDSIVPDALLLNGGVFRSKTITERAIALLTHWSDQKPVLLDNEYPELAVAYGAVSYAMARHDKKLRIGGGAARSYFLQVETAEQQTQGVCILPKGSQEGHEFTLTQQQFALRVGQPVRFHLYSISGDGQFALGELATISDQFHSLPPLAVALQGSDQSDVIVQLAVTYTEVGTLKIQCVSVEADGQRWDVEFQIRKKQSVGESAQLPAQFIPAADLVKSVFGSKSKQVNPNAVKSLRQDIEKQMGISRLEWETPLLRAFFGVLLELMKNRRRSLQHERVWLSLAGFCLRPGFGDELDDWRVAQLWKSYPQGLQFVNERQNWSEWWTLWRRIAGGLPVEAQEKIFSDISKYLNPAAARQAGVSKQIKTRGYDDMVRLAGVLERLPVEKKIQLAQWLLKRLQKAGESHQTWWAVGRIAARVPFHGGSHNVIAPEVAAPWLQQLLKVDWKKIPQAGFAATMIARMSGDRAREIDDELRAQIVDKLRLSKAPNAWIKMVETFQELDEKEEKQIFGEALPPGLKLVN